MIKLILSLFMILKKIIKTVFQIIYYIYKKQVNSIKKINLILPYTRKGQVPKGF